MSSSITALKSANARLEGRRDDRLRPGVSAAVVVGLSAALWYALYALMGAFGG